MRCIRLSTVCVYKLVLSFVQFELFHLHKHTGRKLAWLHHMSTGEIKTSYLKKPYTVCVTTYQMVSLLSFNTKDEHSFSSLLQSTQLAEQELVSTLQSLVDCKILLLEQGSSVEVRWGCDYMVM